MSGTLASAPNALDDLLGTLQQGDLSPLELRMLLSLAEREATQSDLSAVLGAEHGAIGRAARRLAMRGLIARRFERGRRSRFVLRITPVGLSAAAPLIEWLAESHPATPARGHAAGGDMDEVGGAGRGDG